jgi:hypothetical protein
MKISPKIFFIAILYLSAGTSMAQYVPGQDEAREVKLNKSEPVTDSRNAKLNEDKQAQNAENKTGSVKQVKSARPDMSRSRGARPPNIVRPSGSRIPKGVGRPAGAVRHGRG